MAVFDFSRLQLYVKGRRVRASLDIVRYLKTYEKVLDILTNAGRLYDINIKNIEYSIKYNWTERYSNYYAIQ